MYCFDDLFYGCFILMKKYLTAVFTFIIIFFSACSSNKEKDFDVLSLESVCDCYEAATINIEGALTIRLQYSNFDEFTSSKSSVKQLKTYTKRWRAIQQHCVKTFKRKMMMKNDCDYPLDDLEKKRAELYSLGIKPLY
ncbi:MAG: hypothetical protein CMH79_04660 [Nitrospinae bacterium]|nr:hypothetical protein [Nitrospinota bacterium]|tara:strand:+ start:1649 stop:2062 length:414 start_codon:yes stop_codon:yes gene_type:complete